MTPRYNEPMHARQSLPLLWLLSDARNDAALENALEALPDGSGFVYRHYHLHGEKRRARFDELKVVANRKGHTVVLAGPGEWGADGHYGPPDQLGSGLRLSTAHDGDEIRKALEADADAIFLSPVFPTASHPGAHTLGAAGFHVLAQQSPVPIIALGGMTSERAEELGWPRWGAIDGLSSTKTA